MDAATLTGAMVVALGHHRTGVFTTDKELAALLFKIGEETGEKNWTMPMDPEYAEQIKSDWADIKNSGGRPAVRSSARCSSRILSAIRRGRILTLPAVPIVAKETGGYKNKFGNGTPTRTFVNLALALAAKK